MKKFVTIVCTVLACLFTLNGCLKTPLPELSDDGIAFDMGTFHDSEHDALIGSIEYNGRTYILYGTTNNKYRQSKIESCVGYIIQNAHSSSVNDSDNTNRRIYTLAEDPEHCFLMEYDDSIKLMNQPTFLRAVDTKGINIEIPNYIDAFGYEFWGE